MPQQLSGYRPTALFCAVVLLLITVLSSCASRTADAAPPPSAPSPAVAERPGTEPLSVPQTQVALPPEQPVPQAAIPPRPTTAAIMGPEPPPQQEPTPPAPAPSARPVPAEPAPMPQLGRLLTAAQRREYNRVIDQNVTAAKANLDSLARRPVVESQRLAVDRVKAFLLQVEQVRRSDLELARSLSDRARLLAGDLVRNLPR